MFLTEYDEKLHERTLRMEGIEQGELKKAHEIAANMLKDGMAPEKVKSYVNLGDDQWDELLKSLGISD